ncbi:hypothetical protein HK405_009566, partial [Cladochytrium tenue]
MASITVDSDGVNAFGVSMQPTGADATVSADADAAATASESPTSHSPPTPPLPPPPQPASLSALPVPLLERIVALVRLDERRSRAAIAAASAAAAAQSATANPAANGSALSSAASAGNVAATLAAAAAAARRLGAVPGSGDPGGGDNGSADNVHGIGGDVLASLSCLGVSRHVSKAAARAIYYRPHLPSASTFLRLLATCLSPDPATHNYAVLVRHLDLAPHVIADLDLGDVDIALQLFSNVAHLRLGASPTATNVLLQSVADHLGGGGAPASALGPGSALRRLEVRGCPVTDAMLEGLLSSCSGLRWLDLSDTGVSVGAVIGSVTKHCEHLVTLKLVGVTGPVCTTAFAPPPIKPAKPGSERRRGPPPPLAHVDLSRSVSATDRDLRLLADSCGPTMRVLVLSGCARLTDDGVSRVGRVCRRLRSLDLSFLPCLTDLGLFAIGTMPPAPPFLDPSPGAELLAARQVAPALESLNLSGCDTITPAGVLALLPAPSSSSSRVAAVTVGSPTPSAGALAGQRLPSSSSSASAQESGCPQLRELVMHGCAGILPTFVRRFATNASVAAGGAVALDSLECAVVGDGLRLLAAHGRGGWERIAEMSVPGSLAARAGGGGAVGSPRDSALSIKSMPGTPERRHVADQSVQTDGVSGGLTHDAAHPSAASATSAEALLLKFAAAIASGTWVPPGAASNPLATALQGHQGSQLQDGAAGATPRITSPGILPGQLSKSGHPLDDRTLLLTDADFPRGFLDLDGAAAGTGFPDFDDDGLDEESEEERQRRLKRTSLASFASTSSSYSSASAMAAARRQRAAAPSRSGLAHARLNGAAAAMAAPSGIPAPSPRRAAGMSRMPMPAAPQSPGVSMQRGASSAARASGLPSPASSLRKSVTVARPAVFASSPGPAMAMAPRIAATAGEAYRPRQFRKFNSDGLDD